MNFLTIAQLVRQLSGMQGTGPTSVVGTVGVDSVIVQMVNSAYSDIQNMREEWPWLRKEATFPTTAGQATYTTDEMLGVLTNDLKDYKADSFKLDDGTTKSYLKELDEDVMEHRYLNSTSQGKPSCFSVSTADYSLELRDIPDTSYNVTFSYYQQPQILEDDTDVPLMPKAYHNLIVYKTLERLAIYLKTPEIYTDYSLNTDQMLGNLMRGTLKPKRITTRPFA